MEPNVEILENNNLNSIVMNGSKVGEFAKVVKEQNLNSRSERGDMVKSVAMNGVKSGKWEIEKIVKITKKR